MAGSGRNVGETIFYWAAGAAMALVIVETLRAVELDEVLKELGVGFALIVTVALVVWVVWRLRITPTTPTALELSERFEAVRFMGGLEFEDFVADLFGAMGNQVQVCGGAGDQGVDIVVNPKGERIALQCKNHARPVNNKAVQEVYAGARYHRCARAWVVAPAGYTSGAVDLAKSTGVSLHASDSIRLWIKKVDDLEKEREQKPLPPPPVSDEIREAAKRAIWHPHPDDPPKD